MRLSSKAIAACALLSFSPFSHAEFYGGGSAAVSSLHYSDVRAGIGGTGFIGYKPSSVPMVFEAGYLTGGKDKVDGYNGLGVTVSGEYAALGYYGRFGRTGSGGFAKLGYFTGDSRLKGGGYSPVKENTSGAIISLGVDWMLNRNFGFHFSADNIIGINDYRNFDNDHKGFLSLLNAGVVLAFGGDESTYAPRQRRSASPAPVYSAPVAAPVYSAPADAPVYTPAVAPAPAPVVETPAVAAAPQPAPAAAVPASTGTAQLVPGAVLRTGPTMKSAAIRTLADGGSVKLIKRETNGEGPWWLIQLEDGTTGWMIEWGLTRISKH